MGRAAEDEMVSAVCFLFLTYLAAAVPFGVAVTTLYGGDVDIRAEGSGNIGATNVARLYGGRIAAVVLALDVGKGLLPVWIASIGWPAWGVPWWGLVGLVAFLGHIYPVYLAFHGGKGVATGAGVMLGLAPLPTLLAVVAWVIALVASRRSSVASLLAVVVLVVACAAKQPEVLAVAVLLGIGVYHAHVPNIRRLVAGDEAAILRPVRWGRPAPASEPEPEAVLARGPAGAGAPALWRSDGADDGADEERS